MKLHDFVAVTLATRNSRTTQEDLWLTVAANHFQSLNYAGTATDTSATTASCSFSVTVFSGCLQDDCNPAISVLFNASSGQYRFCCNGTIFTGTVTVTVKGCTVTIQHNAADRRVLIKFDGGSSTGSASIQSPPGTNRCTITDHDTRNNSCSCL